MLDGPGDELALLLQVLPPFLEGGNPVLLGARRVADGSLERGDLLRALPEDVPLQLVHGGLEVAELLSLLCDDLALLLDQGALLGE